MCVFMYVPMWELEVTLQCCPSGTVHLVFLRWSLIGVRLVD